MDLFSLFGGEVNQQEAVFTLFDQSDRRLEILYRENGGKNRP